MRTTVTLDSDVEALLKKRMGERGMSFKEAVNTALRESLTASRADCSFPTYHMGEAKVSLTHALRLAADMEDEEILREMSVGR